MTRSEHFLANYITDILLFYILIRIKCLPPRIDTDYFLPLYYTFNNGINYYPWKYSKQKMQLLKHFKEVMLNHGQLTVLCQKCFHKICSKFRLRINLILDASNIYIHWIVLKTYLAIHGLIY